MNKTLKLILAGIIISLSVIRFISANDERSVTVKSENITDSKQIQPSDLKLHDGSIRITNYPAVSMGRFYSFSMSEF